MTLPELDYAEILECQMQPGDAVIFARPQLAAVARSRRAPGAKVA